MAYSGAYFSKNVIFLLQPRKFVLAFLILNVLYLDCIQN